MKSVDHETDVVLVAQIGVTLAREGDDVDAWRVIASNGEDERVTVDDAANRRRAGRSLALSWLDLREVGGRVGDAPRGLIEAPVDANVSLGDCHPECRWVRRRDGSE